MPPRSSARGLNETGMPFVGVRGDGDLLVSLKPRHGVTGGGEWFTASPRWQGGELQLGSWLQRKLSITQKKQAAFRLHLLLLMTPVVCKY